MLKLILIFCFTFLANFCYGQDKLLSVDSSEYPKIKLHFDYLSPRDTITVLNSSGDTIPFQYTYCADSALVATSIDNSGSMYSTFDRAINKGSSTVEDGAQYTAKEIISSIHIPNTHWSLAYCDDVARTLVNQSDTANISLIDSIPYGYSNNFVNQLLQANSGLLTLAQEGNYANRFAIIITDGLWDSLDPGPFNQCLNTLRQYNIRLFCIFLSDGTYVPPAHYVKQDLEALSDSSGGIWFDNITLFKQCDTVVNLILNNFYDPNEAAENEGIYYDGDETFYPCGINFIIKDTCFDQKYYINFNQLFYSNNNWKDTIFVKGTYLGLSKIKLLNDSKKLYTFNSCQDTNISFNIKYNISCIDSLMIDSIKSSLSKIKENNFTFYSNSSLHLFYPNSLHFGKLQDTIILYHQGAIDTILVNLLFNIPLNSFTLNGTYNQSIEDNILNPIKICEKDSLLFLFKNNSCFPEKVKIFNDSVIVNPNDSFFTYFYIVGDSVGIFNNIYSYTVYINDSLIAHENIFINYKVDEIDSPKLIIVDSINHFENQCEFGIDSLSITNPYCKNILIQYISKDFQIEDTISFYDSIKVPYKYHGKNVIDTLNFIYQIQGDTLTYSKEVLIKEITPNRTNFNMYFNDNFPNITLCDTLLTSIKIINNSCDTLFLDSLKNINFRFTYLTSTYILPYDSTICSVKYIPEFGFANDTVDFYFKDTIITHTYNVKIDSIQKIFINYFYIIGRDNWIGYLTLQTPNNLDSVILYLSLKNSAFSFNFSQKADSSFITDSTLFAFIKTINDTIVTIGGKHFVTIDSTDILSVDSISYTRRICDPIIIKNNFLMIYPDSCGDNILRKFLQGKNNSFYVIPNPAQNYIEIKSNLNIDFSIYNLEGKLLLTGCSNAKIDISQLNSGSYFLKSKYITLPLKIIK